MTKNLALCSSHITYAVRFVPCLSQLVTVSVLVLALLSILDNNIVAPGKDPSSLTSGTWHLVTLHLAPGTPGQRGTPLAKTASAPLAAPFVAAARRSGQAFQTRRPLDTRVVPPTLS
jgi:hypothetical protein